MAKDGSLLMCGGCSRKVKKENIVYGEYYCKLIDGIIPNGIVASTTDATECVKKGWYKEITT